MLSFITLAIAYFIKPSASSFLVALLIGSILGNLIQGYPSSIIPEGIAVFILAPVIYSYFQPESFIGFWGFGMGVYIIAFVIRFGIDILFGLFFSLFAKGK